MSLAEPLRVGIVGCGNISDIYLRNLAKFEETAVVAVTDLDASKAQAAARDYGVEVEPDVASIFARSDVDLVLNLTVPAAHFEVSLRALESGKHVYSEKPLALAVAEGNALVDLAEKNRLLLGCAPDTVLGAGIQTCVALVDRGEIGEVVGANAFMLCAGHESWHPSPEFYYRPGGGPLFDMGPYYLAALFFLLGEVDEVCGLNRATFPTRTITSQPLAGTVIQVETPTHIALTMHHVSGAISSLTTSFDVQASLLPPIELYGTEGTLLVPDPNTFGGPVRLKRKGAPDWVDVDLEFDYAENSRGLGVRDMAIALREGCEPELSGELALHALEIMESVLSD